MAYGKYEWPARDANGDKIIIDVDVLPVTDLPPNFVMGIPLVICIDKSSPNFGEVRRLEVPNFRIEKVSDDTYQLYHSTDYSGANDYKTNPIPPDAQVDFWNDPPEARS